MGCGRINLVGCFRKVVVTDPKSSVITYSNPYTYPDSSVKVRKVSKKRPRHETRQQAAC